VRFVLVHGAWHGAWCWERLAGVLRERGHEVDALDLPAQGDDPTDPADATFADLLERIRSRIEPGTTLVGHSLGGYWAHLAAEGLEERLAGIAYLATIVPPKGVPFIEALERARALVFELPAPAPGGAAMPVPADPVGVFYNRTPRELAERAVSRLRPLPVRPLREAPAPDRSPLSVAALAIACDEDRAIAPGGVLRTAADAGVRAVTLQGDHSPFFSTPERLADLLEGVRE
jgi:pimeloyl-ACP methyl ester carboxylesterase